MEEKPCASSVFRPKDMETVAVTHQSRTASRLSSTSSVVVYPPALPSSSNHGVGQGGAHNKSVCVIKEKTEVGGAVQTHKPPFQGSELPVAAGSQTSPCGTKHPTVAELCFTVLAW